jgi:Isoleucyl-tRNA synthetase
LGVGVSWGAQALSSNDALVILDLEIDAELEAEGIARDVVRLIQQARKDADLNVGDRIALRIEADDAVEAAVEAHRDYIAEQTLSAVLLLEPVDGSRFVSRSELAGQPILLGISLAQKDAA